MIKLFLKYAIVGGLGTLVNITTLYLTKSYLFPRDYGSIYGLNITLNICLVLAIFVSVTFNFTLNKIWTWRMPFFSVNTMRQYSFYWIASWASILFQIIGTNLMVGLGFGYIIANIISIASASFLTFYINNKITFG